MTNWEEVRKNYPLIDHNCYLNTASFGAISKKTLESQKAFMDSVFLKGNQDYSQWTEYYHELKNELSEYLNTSAKNLAFVADASNGINKVSEILPRNREVILVEDDFPSIVLPWITRNYKINWIAKSDFLEGPVDAIEAELKKGKRVLAISWVHYNSGLKVDLKKLGELCQQYEAYFVVDATQGLGAFSVDLSEVKIDFLVASCFKWFMAGQGITIAYLSNNLMNGHDLPFSGWNTLKNFEGELTNLSNYRFDAARMEVGHIKYQNMIALYSSFKEMKSIGLENINERTEELVIYLRQKLEQLGLNIITPKSDSLSGILCIEPNKNIASKLQSSDIVCTIRENYIRFSLYFYNNKSDIDYLVSTIKN